MNDLGAALVPNLPVGDVPPEPCWRDGVFEFDRNAGELDVWHFDYHPLLAC